MLTGSRDGVVQKSETDLAVEFVEEVLTELCIIAEPAAFAGTRGRGRCGRGAMSCRRRGWDRR